MGTSFGVVRLPNRNTNQHGIGPTAAASSIIKSNDVQFDGGTASGAIRDLTCRVIASSVIRGNRTSGNSRSGDCSYSSAIAKHIPRALASVGISGISRDANTTCHCCASRAGASKVLTNGRKTNPAPVPSIGRSRTNSIWVIPAP